MGFPDRWTWLTSPRIGRNQFAAGATLDRGSVGYTQNAAYGYLNPNYTITNVPAWQDGSTRIPSIHESAFMASLRTGAFISPTRSRLSKP